jgi:hypothetical protein
MSYGREYLADNAYEIEQAQKKWEDMCIRAANNAMHGLWIKKRRRINPCKQYGNIAYPELHKNA